MPEIAVFAPTTTLSVTVEVNAEVEELHVHAAGQGYWVARMLAVLGSQPLLCTPVGGETGTVVTALLGEMTTEGVIRTEVANGAYVHDRRDGERAEVADIPSASLDRHSVDDLMSMTLACGLRAGVAVVCGSNLHRNVDDDVYQRICADLRAGNCTVLADLSDGELVAALAGGIDVLKLSHEEIIRGGWATGDDTRSLMAGVEALVEQGAIDVVVSRAEDGVLARLDGHWYEATAPTMVVVDPHGAGDSMTAGLAHGIATGLSRVDALRLATGAAALNVTRHGLASGNAAAIEQLALQVEIRELDR